MQEKREESEGKELLVLLFDKLAFLYAICDNMTKWLQPPARYNLQPAACLATYHTANRSFLPCFPPAFLPLSCLSSAPFPILYFNAPLTHIPTSIASPSSWLHLHLHPGIHLSLLFLITRKKISILQPRA